MTPPRQAPREDSLLFAAVGDVHGRMHAMVRMLQGMESRLRRRLRFVLQVGDFEPHRDEADLQTMHGPSKYKVLGDFPDFHAGRAAFPWPVYFIGGNHEPHGWLEHLPLGGTVAPSCHYLGRVGAASPEGLSVLGVSGIFDEEALRVPRPARFDPAFRDYPAFHEADIERALDAGGTPDVLLLHDWPSGIIAAEDEGALVGKRRIPSADQVGNEYARLLVDGLRPRLVFCGHIHQRYRAAVRHPDGSLSSVCCLADVASGKDGFAIFEQKPDGALVELEA